MDIESAAANIKSDRERERTTMHMEKFFEFWLLVKLEVVNDFYFGNSASMHNCFFI
jgi:hypothetical protein